MRRWSDGGRGRYVNVPAASQTIVELLGLKSGAVLVGSGTGLGLMAPDARVTQLQELGGLNFSSGGGRLLRVSADGGIVQVDAGDLDTPTVSRSPTAWSKSIRPPMTR